MPRTALMMRMTGKHHASRRTLPATGTPIGTDLLRLWARVSRAGRCHYHLVPARPSNVRAPCQTQAMAASKIATS
jgi:hypothetical protein